MIEVTSKEIENKIAQEKCTVCNNDLTSLRKFYPNIFCFHFYQRTGMCEDCEEAIDIETKTEFMVAYDYLIDYLEIGKLIIRLY